MGLFQTKCTFNNRHQFFGECYRLSVPSAGSLSCQLVILKTVKTLVWSTKFWYLSYGVTAVGLAAQIPVAYSVFKRCFKNVWNMSFSRWKSDWRHKLKEYERNWTINVDPYLRATGELQCCLKVLHMLKHPMKHPLRSVKRSTSTFALYI